MKEQTNKKGVSLKFLIVLCTILAVLIISSLLGITYAISKTNAVWITYDREMRSCADDATNIERGKAYLTRQTRLYVQNLDESFLNAYFDEVNNVRRLDNAVEDLKTLHLSDEIVSALQAAVESALHLSQHEMRAMKLAALANGAETQNLPQQLAEFALSSEDLALSAEEKLSLARSLVFGEEYRTEHTAFETQLDEFREISYDELRTNQLAMTKRNHIFSFGQNVCLAAFALLTIFVICVWVFWVRRPLVVYEKSIAQNKPLGSCGVKELRVFADGYNKLYMANAADRNELLSRVEEDSLTGLMNQRAFLHLQEELADNKEPMAMIVMDVDRFKQINDDFGHDMGDKILRRVAQQILQTLRPEDRVMRLGGDEFVVVLLNFSAANANVLRRKVDFINETLSKAEEGMPLISVSAGVAFSENGYNESLFKHADQAMYSVKRNGGCGFRVYDGTESLRAITENKTSDKERQKILVVDDSAINRELLSDMLSDTYDVVQAEDGLKAIELIEQQGNSFCLVLLDFYMPNLNGIGVLEYMKKYRWNEILPVMVISSENRPELIAKAYDLGIMDYISRPFSETIIKQRIKNVVRLYLRHKRLAGIVFSQIQDQVDTFDRMISILSQVVEFRNEESGEHVRGVELVTEILLDRLKQISSPYAITVSQARCIRRASVLHDIGKIAIPDGILNKPGKLTAEEFEIVKTHAMEGANILMKLDNVDSDPLIHTAYEICRWHHERFDGKGYPDGLVGDEIPISAQLVSLADVYDALTNDRCYKKAYSHEKAISMILNGECGAFNPLLLKCLADVADVLPERLQDSAEEISRRRENEYLAEEVSKRDMLGYSNKLLSQLTFETARANFYGHATSDKTFYYLSETDELFFSAECAEMLGTEETISHPLDGLKDLGAFTKAQWKTVRNSFTPEKPDATLTVSVKINGETKQVRCALRSVWTMGANPKYLGVVGVLISM